MQQKQQHKQIQLTKLQCRKYSFNFQDCRNPSHLSALTTFFLIFLLNKRHTLYGNTLKNYIGPTQNRNAAKKTSHTKTKTSGKQRNKYEGEMEPWNSLNQPPHSRFSKCARRILANLESCCEFLPPHHQDTSGQLPRMAMVGVWYWSAQLTPALPHTQPDLWWVF